MIVPGARQVKMRPRMAMMAPDVINRRMRPGGNNVEASIQVRVSTKRALSLMNLLADFSCAIQDTVCSCAKETTQTMAMYMEKWMKNPVLSRNMQFRRMRAIDQDKIFFKNCLGNEFLSRRSDDNIFTLALNFL